jgi:hypothetical protein
VRPSTWIALAAALLALAPACSSEGEETVAAPTFSPAEPLRFRTSLEVAMATATPGAEVHYTTDGSAPTAACPVCAGPITIEATTTLRAMATHGGMDDSAAASITYVRRAVDLAVDDGHYESTVSCQGPGGHVVLNRLSPAPEDFPFELRRLHVTFPWSLPVGTPVRLVVYTDTDGDPTNGATLEAVLDVTSLANDGAWSYYVLPSPVTVRGPGDVLVGQVSRCDETSATAHDTNSAAGRTWIGGWSSPPPDPPVLPAESMRKLDEVFDGPHNLMVRAAN